MTGNDLIQQGLTTVTQRYTTSHSGWLHQATLLAEYCASLASYFALYCVVVVERKNKIHVIEEWIWETVFVFELKELGGSRNRATFLRNIGCLRWYPTPDPKIFLSFNFLDLFVCETL